jgi:hypothetical protein
VRHAACLTTRQDAYRVLVGKPEEKKPFGRTKCRDENNIRRDLKEIGWEGVVWVDLAQKWDNWLAFVNAVMVSKVK